MPYVYQHSLFLDNKHNKISVSLTFKYFLDVFQLNVFIPPLRRDINNIALLKRERHFSCQHEDISLKLDELLHREVSITTGRIALQCKAGRINSISLFGFSTLLIKSCNGVRWL